MQERNFNALYKNEEYTICQLYSSAFDIDGSENLMAKASKANKCLQGTAVPSHYLELEETPI